MGTCHAIMTHKKGITNKHQVAQAKKWIIINSFSDATVQCDAETSLIQLTEKISSELGLRHRVSPPYSHQSQGRVERLHRTLHEQIRTIRYQYAAHLGTPASALSPLSLPWIIQHAVFVINLICLMLPAHLSSILKKSRRSSRPSGSSTADHKGFSQASTNPRMLMRKPDVDFRLS